MAENRQYSYSKTTGKVMIKKTVENARTLMRASNA